VRRLTLSSEALKTADEFLQGQDIETLVVRVRSGSPWFEFDVWIHEKGIFKFAIWIATMQVYEVNEMGAASEDPITSFPPGLSYHRSLEI
jgi:hypothetical protein